LSNGLAASAPAAIGGFGHSKSATDRHGQRVDCGYIEQHSTAVLTADGSDEPGGDAGQGDSAAADADGNGPSGGGGNYLATPAAAARSRRGRADVSPAGGGGEERGRHLLSRRRRGNGREGTGTGFFSLGGSCQLPLQLLGDACGLAAGSGRGVPGPSGHALAREPLVFRRVSGQGPRAALESPTWARCCH